MNKLFGFKRGQKGFTLIELLIVIAILGILVAIAVPAVTSFIKTGKVGAANAELASIQTAAVSYYADNGVYPAGTASTITVNRLTTTYYGGSLKVDYTFDANGIPTPVGVVDGEIEWDGTAIKFVDGKYTK